MAEWFLGSGLAIIATVAYIALPLKWWYYLGWHTLGNIFWVIEAPKLIGGKLGGIWKYAIGSLGELLEGVVDRKEGRNKYGEHTDAPPVPK